MRADLGAIACGGAAGATLRWFISERPDPDDSWFVYTPATSSSGLHLPVAVLVANLFGCLLLGALTLALSRSTPGVRRRVLIATATGFCGSLTTFSTFAVDAADLLGARYPAAPGSAALYLAVSLVGGGVAFATGRLLGHTVVASPAR